MNDSRFYKTRYEPTFQPNVAPVPPEPQPQNRPDEMEFYANVNTAFARSRRFFRVVRFTLVAAVGIGLVTLAAILIWVVRMQQAGTFWQ
jgi:hypothetical protein